MFGIDQLFVHLGDAQIVWSVISGLLRSSPIFILGEGSGAHGLLVLACFRFSTAAE